MKGKVPINRVKTGRLVNDLIDQIGSDEVAHGMMVYCARQSDNPDNGDDEIAWKRWKDAANQFEKLAVTLSEIDRGKE